MDHQRAAEKVGNYVCTTHHGDEPRLKEGDAIELTLFNGSDPEKRFKTTVVKVFERDAIACAIPKELQGYKSLHPIVPRKSQEIVTVGGPRGENKWLVTGGVMFPDSETHTSSTENGVSGSSIMDENRKFSYGIHLGSQGTGAKNRFRAWNQSECDWLLGKKNESQQEEDERLAEAAMEESETPLVRKTSIPTPPSGGQ